MVMGVEMGTVTMVPAVLVKLMALMVTANARTESEGVSPMLMRTAVEEGVGVGVGVVPEPDPLLHPMRLEAASARERKVTTAKDVLAEVCMAVSLGSIDITRFPDVA
jgi:hypothetical protein